MSKRQPRRRRTPPRKVNGAAAALRPPPAPATTKQIIATTRQLTRLEAKRNGVRRTLAHVLDAIAAKRRELHALTAEIELPLGRGGAAALDDVLDPRD